MKYERLTHRLDGGRIAVDFIASKAGRIRAIDRLAELEDKMEQGELVFINEPFIRTEKSYKGDKRFIICQYDTDCFIEYGWFDNEKEAEAKLKELRGKTK